MSTSPWTTWISFTAFVGAVYYIQRYFQRKAQTRMLQTLRSHEWWAKVVGSKVQLAHLYEFADGSCQIVDPESDAYSFESRARAENWMREEKLSRVADLIAAGELPKDYEDQLDPLRQQ